MKPAVEYSTRRMPKGGKVQFVKVGKCCTVAITDIRGDEKLEDIKFNIESVKSNVYDMECILDSKERKVICARCK